MDQMVPHSDDRTPRDFQVPGNSSESPSMSALKRLALALGVTIDELVFDEGERGPDDDLRLQFDAISQFAPEEKRVAKELLDSLILKHQARRWTGTGVTHATKTKARPKSRARYEIFPV